MLKLTVDNPCNNLEYRTSMRSAQNSERKFQGANVPGKESSTRGTFAPGGGGRMVLGAKSP